MASKLGVYTAAYFSVVAGAADVCSSVPAEGAGAIFYNGLLTLATAMTLVPTGRMADRLIG